MRQALPYRLLIAIAVTLVATSSADAASSRNERTNVSRRSRSASAKSRKVETRQVESTKTDSEVIGATVAPVEPELNANSVPNAKADTVAPGIITTDHPDETLAPGTLAPDATTTPAGTATITTPTAATVPVTVVQPDRDGKCHAPFPFNKKFSRMQRVLERRLRAAGMGRYLDKKQLGVALVDLSMPGRAYYAGVNDNDMMYAASLPKIAILLSVIKSVNEGKLEWTHEYEERLGNMIRASNNSDASWGAEVAGLDTIESTMRDPDYCLYDNDHGGLWVGHQYGPRGGTNRDPLQNLSHAATARQTARFYTMLDEGLLVSKHWSFRMLGLMSPPAHHHKFVGGLNEEEGVTFLARKSGTWRNWHSDSALIQHHGKRYVAVGISESPRGERIMQQLIKVLDDIVMDGDYRPRDNRQASLP